MADNLSDDAIKQAVLAARKPSNLVTEADVEQPSIAETLYDIGAAIPSAVSRYVSSVPERFSAATERVSQMSPMEIAQSLGSTAKTMIVDPAVQAFTAPARAYRGEIPQDQMLPEALNFTGITTLGAMPASALERSGGMMLGTSGTRMVPEAAAVELAKRQLSPVGLYSHGAEAAMALPQATGSVDQMIAMLRKQSGVTEAELRNAGLLTAEGQVNPDWLAKGKIGREDIASHLQSRMPQVEETVLGYSPQNEEKKKRLLEAFEAGELDYNPFTEPDRSSPKYESYTLPGGENYREVLLRLPQVKNKPIEIGKLPATELFERNMMEKYGGNDFRSIYQKLNGNEIDKYNMLIRDEINTSKNESLLQDRRNNFQSQHWDEPNILAHIRMADRTGPNGEKILHVEEVQSDWGQKGKKEGFADPLAQQKLKEMTDRFEKLGSERESIRNKIAEYHNKNEPAPKELIDRVYDISNERNILTNKIYEIKPDSRKNIPSAPYVTSTQGWTDLALKRILKEAAEGGYDKVVWTPGAEQVGRYDLSKSLSKIAYNPDTGYFQALDLNGNPAINQKIETSKLPDLVGKETAEKLLSQKPNNLGVHQLETSDLTIGGEGMKEYYDKILPKRLQEIVKRHDKNAKIGSHNVLDKYNVVDAEGKIMSTHINPLNAQLARRLRNDANFLGIGNDVSIKKSPMEMLGIDITPQMRESILKGQGAFMKGGRVGFAEGGDSLVDRSKLPGATIKPYEPTWKDRIANLLLGWELPSPERERFVEGLIGSRGLGTTGMSVSDFIPLAGQVLPAQEAIKEGDYKSAAMSLIPMEGSVAKQLAANEARALKGLTYETAQHGPFYRVSPRATGEDQPLFSRIGEKEWTGSPADIGGTGQSAYGTTQSEPLTGKAAVVVPPPEQNVPFQAANQYVVDRGYTPIVQPEMPRSSLAKQSAIGRTFALALEGSPEYKASVFEAYQRAMPEVVAQSGAKNYDQLMEASYRQMAKETDDQFRRLPLRFSFHKAGEGDYENSAQMLKDVHDNNHLFVFQGGSKHDYLHNIDPETGLNENEKFRAVHDAFGHAILGNTFGAQGEERAWGLHSQMYSPLARLAMTAETRGQNSFVNYTPVNMKVFDNLGQYEMQMADAISRGDKATIEELKRAKKQIMSDWQYAPQSAVLLPPEFLSTSYAGGMPEYVRGIIRPAEGTSFGSTLAHFSRNPSLVETNPSLYGSGLKGAERERLFSPELQGGVTDRSYFYLGHPSRVNPERGLGPYKYVASSENLYDWSKDPAGLWAIAQELNRAPATAAKAPAWINMPQAMNDLERLVKEYGYAGVANPKHQYPMAVMFDPTAVQKVRADGGRTMRNNAIDNALRMARLLSGRSHFGYGGETEYSGSAPEKGATGSSGSTGYNAGYGGSNDNGPVGGGGGGGGGDRDIFGGVTGGGSDRSSPTSDPVKDALEKSLPNKMTGVEGAEPVGMPTSIKDLMNATRATKAAYEQEKADQEAAIQRSMEIAQGLRSSSFFSPTTDMGFNVNPMGPAMGQASSTMGFNPTDVEGRSVMGPVSGPDTSIMGFNPAGPQSMMTQTMRDALTMQGQPAPSSGWQMSDADIDKLMSSVGTPSTTVVQNTPVMPTPTVEKAVIFDPVQQSFVPASQASQQALQLAQAEAVKAARVMANLMPSPNAPMAAFPHSPTPSTATQVASYDRPAFPHTPTPSTATHVASYERPAFPHTPTPVTASQGSPTVDSIIASGSTVAPTTTVASLFNPVSNVMTNVPLPVARPVEEAILQNVPLPPVVTRDPIKAAVMAAKEPVDPLLAGGADLATRKAASSFTGTSATGVPMPTARPQDLKSEPNFLSQILDSIKADLALKEGERINALEAAGKTATFPDYSTASDPMAAQREYMKSIGLNPENPEDVAKVQARIIQEDGQDKVDYYTKTLWEALFGPSTPKTTDQFVPPPVGGGGGGGGGGEGQSSGLSAGPGRKRVLYPFETELGESAGIPSLDGMSAQQWANANTGGDLSQVHAKLDWSLGAPRVVYYK